MLYLEIYLCERYKICGTGFSVWLSLLEEPGIDPGTQIWAVDSA